TRSKRDWSSDVCSSDLNISNRSVFTMRTYDKEFKNYVVKLVVEEGKRMTDVARELDVHYDNVRRWIREYRKEEKRKADALEYVTPSEHKEREKELLDRISELEEENAIIKKAARIFAKNNQE